MIAKSTKDVPKHLKKVTKEKSDVSTFQIQQILRVQNLSNTGLTGVPITYYYRKALKEKRKRVLPISSYFSSSNLLISRFT